MDIQLGKKLGSNLTGNVMGKGVCGGWRGGGKGEFNSTGHNYLTSKIIKVLTYLISVVV